MARLYLVNYDRPFRYSDPHVTSTLSLLQPFLKFVAQKVEQRCRDICRSKYNFGWRNEKFEMIRTDYT